MMLTSFGEYLSATVLNGSSLHSALRTAIFEHAHFTR